jgi:N utilization substance protein B
MISRRNIRVKVMQTLYSIDSMSGDVKPGESENILSKKIEQSRQIFTYLVYFMTEVARYSETDARQKASKHLPTAADLNINTKIAGNELLWKIVEEPSFKAAVATLKPQHIMDAELLKKTYLQLVSSPEYAEYIEEQSRNNKAEKGIEDAGPVLLTEGGGRVALDAITAVR